MSGNYLVIDKRVLPDVYEKVLFAKKLLKDGKVKEITEAVKQAGISRSVYYKYKDHVFDFSETSEGRKVTYNMILKNEKGVLSNISNYIASVGGDILTINQGIPLNGYANLSITIDLSTVDGDLKTLTDGLTNLNNIEKVEFIGME
ncbi:ACT domain-containing protein [Clostridium sp. SM-530-WT-3G]|uniref:ACT domain-containing protein n=1 Tax=Clostridium sp. SM-530-WT-3G TaxID=2725303 RepID=UPI000EEC09D5|nr:ACT domain-containing protein [Clostridium sp. SM-530-WT-3G]NME81957.1 ACT domain-containing protein [Clostridium sp. SM-530-WT-3G]HCW52614.1 ACT domain-containing protein [Clostridium sp.]